MNLGKITSYDASGIPGYQNLTTNNFIVEIISAPSVAGGRVDGRWGSYASGCTVSKNYNASTGIFTVSGLSQTIAIMAGDGSLSSRVTQSFDYRVYLIA